MSDEFARNVLKVAMAQICQNLGWHSVQTAPMNILVDILQRYMSTVAKITHQYAEHYNRIEPNLIDLGLAFKELGVSLTELEEYVNNVEPVPFAHPIPKFPVSRSNQFSFPKESSREVSLRPEWIHPHLPCIYPEDEDSAFSSADVTDKGLPDGSASEVTSPCSSPKPGSRRPLELAQDGNFPSAKRPRLLSDEDGRQVREVVSVSMTPAGLISPYREGRLPDTCTPLKGFEDSRPSSPVISEEAEESPPPSVAPVVEPPPVLPPVLPPEVNKPKKSKVKDGTKHKVKVKKDNKENKKKDLKESKSKKKDALKAQLKMKDKLAKLAKVKKLKSYKLPKVPKIPKLAKPGIDSSKHNRKLGRPKKLKSEVGAKLKSMKLNSASLGQKAIPSTSEKIKFIKHSQKPPKVSKPGKSPKSEKTVAGGQLASLLAKASTSNSVKLERFSPEFVKSCEHDPFVRDDSPVRANVSGMSFPPMNFHDHRSSESFVTDVNPRGLSDYDHHANSNSSSNLRSDSEGIPSFRSKIKLEPKDVYDFTDDEDNRNAAASEECREKKIETSALVRHSDIMPPVLPQDIMRPVIPGPEIKPLRKRGRPRKYPKKEPDSPIMSNPRPRTPEPYERSPPMMPQQRSPFSGASNFGMPPLGPSFFQNIPLANIPPALLPFPMGTYSSPGNPPPMSMGSPVASSSGMAPYTKLVDLANVAISKAQHDGDFDLGRLKDKEKVKRSKGKRDKKDKDKQKVKKKKDKAKDKSSDKGSAGKVEKNRDKNKTKKIKSGESTKSKDKKEKSEKSKEKKKDKSRDKEKRTEKKKEKPPKPDKEEFREEKEVDRLPSPTSGVAFPRLTFKLGSGTESESPKIVIKGLSNTDSPSSSPLPYASERSPPGSPMMLPPMPVQRPVPGVLNVGGSSHGKSHSKAPAKVQPVPPPQPPPQPPPPPSSSSQPPPPPARTVITETVGTIIDASGNKIWICPACTHPDDGSPMIGCDDCDEWYHWVCVGIVVPPSDDENWFCSRCIAKQQTLLKKRRYRKDNVH